MKISKKKLIKLSIVLAVIVAIVVMGVITFNSIFGNSENNRYKDIDKYKLTDSEIKGIKESFKDIEQVSKISVEINSKKIVIDLTLSEDVDFNKLNDTANSSLGQISSENLSFYDVEIFVESLNKESEVYPKIGYKHKSKEKFTW